MNILSLFDGLSCGQIALNKLGIKYDNYYASEIDKYAISITQKNYPNTTQIGSVTEIKGGDLPKIDLLFGGSPCQSFSIAGDGSGFDGSSKLFWEYVRVLNEVKEKNPNVKFLLENVKMKKEWEDIITEALGVKPIEINSRLLSAQNRPRLYWTNIEGVDQPEDKGLALRDILEDKVDEKYYLSQKAIDYMGRLRNGKERWEYHKNPVDGKAACLTANMYKGVPYGVIKGCHQVAKLDMKGNDSIRRVYDEEGKSPTLTTMTGGHRQPKVYDYPVDKARKLTPLECERLQTIPDNYTKTLESVNYSLHINQEIDKNGKLCVKKNVKLLDVKERLEPINSEISALCITKDIKDLDLQNFQKRLLTKRKNVSFAIEKLEKKVAEQEECVIDITKIGLDTETLYTQISKKMNLDQEDTKKELMVRMSTGKLWRISWEENLKEGKSFIILTLLKLIIELKISSYVKAKANIQFCIDSLNHLQGDWLKLELSDLKMESIISCSNSQRYKMIGNGWTVDVIAHIFKNLT